MVVGIQMSDLIEDAKLIVDDIRACTQCNACLNSCDELDRFLDLIKKRWNTV